MRGLVAVRLVCDHEVWVSWLSARVGNPVRCPYCFRGPKKIAGFAQPEDAQSLDVERERIGKASATEQAQGMGA